MPINHYFGDKKLEFIRMKGPKGQGISEMAYRVVDGPGLSRYSSHISLNDVDFELLEVIKVLKSILFLLCYDTFFGFFKVIGVKRRNKTCSCFLSACCCFTKNSLAQDNNKRRMSDPSGDLEKKLENFKNRPIHKSRSENQVLQPDEYGINEIEATDFTKGIDIRVKFQLV